MGSVFSRIYNLLRYTQKEAREDFLTELLAGVFEDKELLKDFFKHFTRANISDPRYIIVETQKCLSRLPEHEMSSRPDLAIQFHDEHKNYIAFFENKIDTGEGELQLQRYADQLAKYECFERYLFYITSNYDPKKETVIFRDTKTCSFLRLRWYQVYNWLLNRPSDYVTKVLQYMEEQKMNQVQKFMPQDIFSLQQINRLISMMNDCMDGEPLETMTNLFGKSGSQSRYTQLKNTGYRYFEVNDQGDWFFLGYGFYLQSDDYPSIAVLLSVKSSNPSRDSIVEAMKWFRDNNEHYYADPPDCLEYPSDWPCIHHEKSFTDFLNEENHIKTIQKFFINEMNMIDQLKKQYPDLGWKSV